MPAEERPAPGVYALLVAQQVRYALRTCSKAVPYESPTHYPQADGTGH